MIRVGMGVDVHPFEEGRKCILGGVHIPHPRGLKGHSDADALVHAVMDALLGALGEKDIGHFFPDTDSKWKDADSVAMLKTIGQILTDRKAKIHNIDVNVIAQEPRISPHIQKMTGNVAGALNIPVNRVGIKATTSEWMGFTGRKEGIVALAVCCLDDGVDP